MLVKFKRVLKLLLPVERKKAMKVVGTTFCNSLLDFIGLAALLPVLYYLLEGMENSKAAILFCTAATIIIVIKSVVSIYLTRFQSKFLLDLYKRLSFSLYSSYYNRGLLFIRQHGTSRLGYEVNYVSYTFSFTLLSSFADISGDLLFIFLLIVALLVYSPLMVLILTIAFIPFVLFYVLVIRKKAKLYGEKEMLAKRGQARVVSDTFGGYAELEVSNAFPIIRNSFLEGMNEIGNNRLKMATIMRLPMLLSELAVILGLTILVIFGGPNAKMLVAIFAVAAFKLLPAVRSILSGWTNIENSLLALDILEEGLKDYHPENKEEITDLSFENEITLSNISYTYPDGIEVFKDFNNNIRKGEYVGFSGYSGVGKSTLFNLLLGFLMPDSGAIKIDNIPLTAKSRTAWLKRVGYVSQEVFIFNGSLAENITLGDLNPDKNLIENILHQVSLYDWVQTLPAGIDEQFGERGAKLSGGQRQRIGIARALYKNIDILLLDEATSSLDNETEREINDTLCELRKKYPLLTILSIAHRDSSLAYCDRVIKIE